MVFTLVSVHDVNAGNTIKDPELQMHYFASVVICMGQEVLKCKLKIRVIQFTSVYTDATEMSLVALRVT